MTRVGVVGTTSWGTTLAILMARYGHEVWLWARNDDEKNQLLLDQENKRFVSGHGFPDCLGITSSMDHAFGDSEMLLFAVPSHSLRSNVNSVGSSISADSLIVSATKGLEATTSKRMTEVIAEELPSEIHSNICALSGPNLASEIADGKPSSTVVASMDPKSSGRAQKILNSQIFRVYTNDDVIGVEVGGALKNIIAIGVGISDGLGYGDNAKATLISRGLTEMARLGSACGGKKETFAGLTGMGDLIATCSSSLSRNHQVGELLAQGKSLKQVSELMDNVAEGIDTTNAAYRLSKQMNVDMPITNALYGVLFGSHTVKTAISELLDRLPGRE